jgi:hypothetical protein
MTTGRDAVAAFREEYLEYLEGERNEPPSIERLPTPAQRAMERWLKSLHDARGIDPYASRPSGSDLLGERGKLMPAVDVDELERLLAAANCSEQPLNVNVSAELKLRWALSNAAPVLLAAARLAEAECALDRLLNVDWAEAPEGDEEFDLLEGKLHTARAAYLAARGAK